MWQRVQTRGSAVEGHDLGTRKSALVLIIVVACFAVLWPKIFYPMIVGSQEQRMRPNERDKGCCNVISEQDVNTIEIITDLCNKIAQPNDGKVLNTRQMIAICRAEVIEACGIDIEPIMDERVRLGTNFKQIVDEIRSLNGSLCLKQNFRISSWTLGSPHKISTANLTTEYIRQERPSHLRPEMLHPALREKGRAITHPQQVTRKGTRARVIEGRPGPVPGVRPPMGGAGHVVPSPKASNNMGLIMPVYTIGIVIFFTYTLMKVIFRKAPDPAGGGLYEPLEPDPVFRREVFEGQGKPRGACGIVNAMSALLDEVDHELEEHRRCDESNAQKSNGDLANGSPKCADREVNSTVKVLGMETMASCEGGQRWTRPESAMTPPPRPRSPTPPQEIFLEGKLPSKSQLLVTDTRTEQEDTSGNSDPGVILASKMTLNVISPAEPTKGAAEDEEEEELLPEPELNERILSRSEIANLREDLDEIAALAQQTVDRINDEEGEEEIEEKIETRGARFLDHMLAEAERQNHDEVEDGEDDDEVEEDEEEEEISIEYDEENEDGQPIEIDQSGLNANVSNHSSSNELENMSDNDT